MSDAQTKQRNSLYDQVCAILETRKSDDETDEEFKIRAAKEFNAFSDEEWEELSDGLQMWVQNVTETMARNLGKQRATKLPGLPGLDATVRRFNINQPIQRQGVGRKRVKGEDSVTRVMTIMATLDKPEDAKVEEVRNLVNEKYNVVYGDSAIKQAMAGFVTARNILGLNSQRAAAE